MMPSLTFIDRAIAWAFPRWGVARAAYRAQFRSYEAARQDRMGDWYPVQNAPRRRRTRRTVPSSGPVHATWNGTAT